MSFLFLSCKFAFDPWFSSDPRDYLKHVMKATNMSCLTPEGAISGECDFLSANMYARSLFGKSTLLRSKGPVNWSYPLGEDALANLSVERTEAGTITGHVRIRSKTQGIALSLGDRITMGTCDSSLETDVLSLMLCLSPAQKDNKPPV